MFLEEKVGTSSLSWHLPIGIVDEHQARSDQAQTRSDKTHQTRSKMFSLIDHGIYISILHCFVFSGDTMMDISEI